MTPHIAIPHEQVREFCRRWRIVELSLFGSVLREDFRPDSDIDVLVAFEPGSAWSLLDSVRMERELKIIFGREVDLVTRRAVEHSPNWIRRQAILASARSVYAAG